MVTRIQMIPAESKKMMDILAEAREEQTSYDEKEIACLVHTGKKHYKPYSSMSREQLNELFWLDRENPMSDENFRRRAHYILIGSKLVFSMLSNNLKIITS